MTDEQIIHSSRALVDAVDGTMRRREIPMPDRTALASMALSELLARYLGPVGTIEHLRDVADALERQLIA